MTDEPARVAVVTGGAQGLGLGIARRLVRDGYRVAIIDIQPHLPAAAEDALGPANRWRFFSGDVADESRLRAIERAITGDWGAIDGLVNNAGIFPRHDSASQPLAEWERVLRVNLTGSFLCAQVFSQSMRRHGRGAIVNTASGRAFHGAARGAAYAASKAGIIGLTRSLAVEWGPLGIRVNCVVPGLADTAQPRQELSEEQMEAAARTIPLRRIGQPADVAAAVAFLLSDDAAYITGQCLGVNGGAVLI